ncbi:cyclohexadienyl dehydratase [Pedobacter steynii]|uniref:Cyclohexadienyl dehydratase n=1 Tax=Pedobacter steynii TaxID=430522 RepID=A0A1G9NSW1_9SPHI|nr:transporter substrate-binding domain-containing protein [Pedobacter steynii]NQX39201.1 transporter substrate-binding domain-containing protein [Pedobacter steynii]SDL89479.1 cyclohexadienyl dehydratase [Pedobacter steynii]
MKLPGLIQHFYRHYVVYTLLTLLLLACSPKIKPDSILLRRDSILRVGTTGDYPPLTSFDTLTGKFTGDEINMALALGKHLGKKVVFVKTSWKMLTEDMLANKFDLALGGISVNAARSKLFNFSSPLLLDRKVAVFRLSDQSRFLDFKSIDQPNVRVIENIGGTNEIFAKQHIRQANLQVIADNQQVFKALLSNTADVMFTDETEAKYQQKKHPELSWLSLDEEISPAYAKAIMYAKKDTLLLQTINNWLKKYH